MDFGIAGHRNEAWIKAWDYTQDVYGGYYLDKQFHYLDSKRQFLWLLMMLELG